MFTSRSRVRGRQGSRRRGWGSLQVLSLERRIAPAQLLVTSSLDDGSAGALRAIIATANTNGEADTITFGPAVTSITLATGQLVISENKNLTIDGGGVVTINGAATPSATNRLFNLTANKQPTVELRGLTLAKGNLSAGNGGAVLIANQPVVFSDVVFSQNATTGSGGAIYVLLDSPTITMNNCNVNNNVAGAFGGGYYSSSSMNLVLNQCNFIGNTAQSNGGGLRFGSGAVTMNGCKIMDNILDSKGTTTSGYGAGCYFTGANKVIINNTYIENNQGNNNSLIGIGVYSSGSIVTFTGCSIKGNSTNGPVSTSYGGGIYGTGYGVTITNSTIENNSLHTTSRSYGAGICAESCGISIIGSTIASNIGNTGSWSFGGGIYCSVGSLSIVNSTIAGNSISSSSWAYGAGIYSQNNSVLVRNSTIAKNRIIQGGYSYGAGAFVLDSETNVISSIITQNTVNDGSSTGGGGLHIEGTSTVTNAYWSIITANKSSAGDMTGYPSTQTIGGGVNIVGPTGSTIVLAGPGNMISSIAPGLFPLGNYGGPTKTMALHYTSTALDRGNNGQQLTTDQRGLPREVPAGSPDVGAVEGFENLPFVDSVSTFADVKAAGGTDLTFTVTYDSPIGIDTTTIDGNDIAVSGRLPVQQVTLTNIATVGNRVTATYKVIPPGGTWDSSDTGSYTISLAGSQVFDVAPTPNPVSGQELGSFIVSIAGKFVVDSTGDAVDGNYTAGQFTLREALEIANVDLNTIDTISFDSIGFASPSTITVNTELPITSRVVINGPGAGLLTLSGSGTSRIMNITTFLNSTINNMTFANGQATGDGGAILTQQRLVMSNCTFVNNFATGNGGAIYSQYELTLTSCQLIANQASGTGGAINHNSSWQLNVSLSSFGANSAGTNGGAMWFGHGNVVVSRCSIYNNASANGGGMYLSANAGGYPPVIENCTLSGNSATNFGGGIFQGNLSITWTIRNSTITANSAGLAGGGIFRGSNTGSVNLASVIVSGNQATSGPDLFFDVPTVVPSSNSLVGIADAGNFTLSGAANLAGTKSSPLDAKLGPLANNGGPTLTHALLIGSPAVNTGNNANKLTVDQRGTGFARVVGGQADIGAFEVQTPPPRATAFQVNDGSGQRSRVTSFRVTFSEAAVFPNGPSAAIELLRTGPDTPIGAIPCIAVANGNEVTITFSNGGAIALDSGGSLPDGKYQLSIIATQLVGVGGFLDGNGNGTPGDNANYTVQRLFGDSNGDGQVTAFDFNAFRIAWATNNTTFDFNNDGIITAADFSQFRLRYGVIV